MTTCTVCGAELAERHHVLELAATRPPYEPKRWPFCSPHADGITFVLPLILSAAAGPDTTETPDV